MKKKLLLVTLAATSLVLAACDDPAISSTSGGDSDTSVTSQTDSSTSSSNISSSSDSSSSTSSSSTQELTKEQIWNAALAKDYSNSTMISNEAIGGSSNGEVYEYNTQGYNVIDDRYGVATAEDIHYLFYHDYEGESYLYFEDEGRGDAWLKEGYKNAPLGIENTYFDLLYLMEELRKVDYSDVQYGLQGNPLYYITDEDVMAELNQTIFKANFIEAPYFAYCGIGIDEKTMLFESIVAFVDYDDTNNYFTAALTDYGNTTFVNEPLPPAPNEENVRTYADYKGEDPYVEKRVTAIHLSSVEPDKTTLEGDEEALFEISYDPIDANNYIFSPVTSDPEIVTFEHSAETNQYVAYGKHEGTATISVVDDITGIESNKIEITVKGPKDPVQTDVTNRVRFTGLDVTNGHISYTEHIPGAGKLDILTDNVETVDVRMSSTNSDLKLTYPEEPVLIFTPGQTVNDVAASIEIDTHHQDVHGISFLYGYEFESHYANRDYLEARILTSDDGDEWVIAKDWTSELRNTISPYNMKLFEMEFEGQARHIKIEFDTNFIGKSNWVDIQEINLYKNDASITEVPVTDVVLTLPDKVEVNDTFTLTAKVLPENATDKSLVFSSSNETIVEVVDSTSGQYRALAEGHATLIATSEKYGITRSIECVVSEDTIDVTSVTITNKAELLTMEVGDTKAIIIEVLPINATNKALTYASSDTGVATVTSDGTITAVEEGTTTITVTSANGIKDEFLLTVNPKVLVRSLTINNTETSLSLNRTLELDVTVDADGVVNQQYTVTLSDDTLASVTYTDDGAPVINPLKPGHLIVTATSKVDPSVKDTLELDINPVAIEYYGYEGVYTVLTADSTFNGEAVETVRVELLKDDDDRATMLLTVNNGDVIELFCYDWDSWDNTAYYKNAGGSIDVMVTDNGIDGIDIMSIDYSWAIYAKEFVNITGVTLDIDKKNVAVGDEVTITAEINPTIYDEAITSVEWEILSGSTLVEEVASTDQLVKKYTAVGEGTVSVKVTINGQFTDTLDFEIKTPVTGIPAEFLGTWTNPNGTTITVTSDKVVIDEIDYDGDDYLNTWATYDVGAEFAFTGYESGIVQLEDTVSYDTADMAFNSDGETIYLYSNYTGWYFDYFARV